MNKKLLIGIIAGVVAIGAIIGGVVLLISSKEEDKKTSRFSEGLSFYLNQGGKSYSVSGIGTCIDTDIVIPSVYEGLPVTSIDNGAFWNCTSLTSIEIPESVKYIGLSAFFRCSSLTSIVIPDSIISIGEWAFECCTSLTYNEYDNAYYLGNDENPYVVLIKAKDTNITSCEIHEYTKIICDNAFYHCTSLTSIEMPDFVTSIGRDALSGCTSLTSIYIPNSVTSIGYGAFWGCTSLTSIVIPNSVTSIGVDAFYNCSSLTSIVIPDSVTNIDSSSFSGCTSLIYNQYDNAYYLGNDENPYAILIKAKDTNITSCEIHENTKIICPIAFSNCASLSNIVVPDSVTSIGDSAFTVCKSLTSIVIPDSVTSIGYYAFYGCYSLIEVINKSSLNIVEGYSDYGDVGYYAKRIITDESESAINFIGDYIFYDDGTEIYFVKYIGSDTEITLPEYDGGKEYGIYKHAFYKNDKITSVIIPDTVTSIGNYAFESCTSLTSINFEGSVEQWNSITKGSRWNDYVPATEVICSDGSVELN